MAEWTIKHLDHAANVISSHRPLDLGFSLVNCDEGEITYELALSDPGVVNDNFGPYRTDYVLVRGTSNTITSGMHTSVNLNKDRDSIFVGGNDWLHYFKRRIYPFDPAAYRGDGVDGVDNPGYWKTWPKKWVDEDLRDITQQIIRAMIEADGTPANPLWVPDFIMSNNQAGITHRYKIFPADQTSIFDHIKTLSEIDEGFEFAVSPINLEFFMYYPDRDSGNSVYHIRSTGSETTGQIIEFDWTNNGPRGTWTLGLGSTSKARNAGATKTDIDNKNVFRRLDIVEEFGEVSNQTMLNKKTDFQGSTNLGPEKTLTLVCLNPEFMTPNFYTGGRPRSLIGNRVRVTHNFGYRMVDAYFRIQALRWTIDREGNELVQFDLEMIAPRLV